MYSYIIYNKNLFTYYNTQSFFSILLIIHKKLSICQIRFSYTASVWFFQFYFKNYKCKNEKQKKRLHQCYLHHYFSMCAHRVLCSCNLLSNNIINPQISVITFSFKPNSTRIFSIIWYSTIINFLNWNLHSLIQVHLMKPCDCF